MRNLTPEMKAMQESLSVDYRIMRVVLASDNPIDTVHKIRTGVYSIRTLLDTLEVLDAKATIEEYEALRVSSQNK